MRSFSRQRLVLLYCCIVELICGSTWSTLAFPERSYGWSIKDAITEEPHDPPKISMSTEGIETVSIPEANLRDLLPQMYHSPQVFALNYNDMTNNLRIFLYPTERNFTAYEYGAVGGAELPGNVSWIAGRFFQLLAKSENYATEDPEQAQLFFLPISIDALWGAFGPGRVGEHLRHYLQQVRDDFPFWDRSLGADHFYLNCRAYDPINHRNALELAKNAIQVACSPLSHNQAFFPHKDIVLPFYKPSGPAKEISSAVQQSRFAYFTSPLEVPEVDAVSASMLQIWASDPDFEVETGPTSRTSSSFEKLASSKFCVSVFPHVMLNVVDSLRFRCVPVLVSDSIIYDLPFQDVLNWHAFSVVLGVQDIPNLKSLLAGIPDEKYRQMQYLGHQASKHMEWNDPPAPYDAFHMTLYELWVRRHSIKYARRSDSVPDS